MADHFHLLPFVSDFPQGYPHADRPGPERDHRSVRPPVPEILRPLQLDSYNRRMHSTAMVRIMSQYLLRTPDTTIVPSV